MRTPNHTTSGELGGGPAAEASRGVVFDEDGSLLFRRRFAGPTSAARGDDRERGARGQTPVAAIIARAASLAGRVSHQHK